MLQIHLLLSLSALLVSPVCQAQQKPRFKSSLSVELVQQDFSPWSVSTSNQVTFLKARKDKQIQVSLEGDNCTSRNESLLIKCPGSTTFDQQVSLSHLTSSTQVETHCSDSLPFTVKYKYKNVYNLQITSSKLAYSEVFNSKIELKVQVKCTETNLESGSLFVWNLDSLSTVNTMTADDTLNGINYSPGILTKEAVRFLIKMDVTGEFDSVNFIDSSVVTVINRAPEFIKSKFFAGAILDFGILGECGGNKFNEFVSFQNGITTKSVSLMKHYFLNIEDGKLYFATRAVTSAIKREFETGNVISVCASIGIAGKFSPYSRKFNVINRLKPDGLVSYDERGTEGSSCQLPGGVTGKSVTVFSGMDGKYLVCPIICSDSAKTYTFKHNGMTLTSPGVIDWEAAAGSVSLEIHRSRKIVKLPNILKNSHSGKYVCSAGNVNFTFDVRVVSLPHFHSDGMLPSTIYAMEGEELSYNCITAFTNIHSVTLTPWFETNQGAGNAKWHKYDIDGYKTIVNAGDQLTSKVTSDTQQKTLTVTVSRVPSEVKMVKRNFTHRFVCEASVSSDDAVKLGMTSYSVSSGADVFFVKRPTLKDFRLRAKTNCSVDVCKPSDGGEFEVTLSEEMTQQLRSAGVEVTAYFRYNQFLLANVPVLQSPDVSETTFNKETNSLMFRVKTEVSEEVLETLKSANLTPVFNFRYKDGSDMRNLRMVKDKHGVVNSAFGDMDCLADTNCFYSTDFDINDALKGLIFHLNSFESSTSHLPDSSTPPLQQRQDVEMSKCREMKMMETRMRAFCRSFCG